MEKRISYSEFQQVKSVAKAMDPIVRKKAKIQAQLDNLEAKYKIQAEEELAKLKQRIACDLAKEQAKLQAELETKDQEISMFETGVVNSFGFHVLDVVKKVIEPDAKGNKITKYLATDIVSYDEQAKEFVIALPDEEPVVPPTTEEGPGSDYDADAENLKEQEEETPVEEPVEESVGMPWDQ